MHLVAELRIRMNAFALPGRTNENTINTQGVASLALGYALVGLSACPLRLPWAMRSLGFAMHYWLHLSNSSMLDCIRFERSFSPFETKSETLVKYCFLLFFLSKAFVFFCFHYICNWLLTINTQAYEKVNSSIFVMLSIVFGIEFCSGKSNWYGVSGV